MTTVKPVTIAINGLGRIGRAALRLALDRPEFKIVAINDLGEPDNLAYLLKYDSAYGRSRLAVSVSGQEWQINDQIIKFFQEPQPTNLPWGKLGVEVVIESTGAFNSFDQAKAHIDAGAKKVVISAPVKGEVPPGLTGATILMGVNDHQLPQCQISSNASCTTNAAGPVVAVLDEAIGIKSAMLNTVHGYTASQNLVDGPNKKDWRRGRAAAVNIIPSSTGATQAVTKAYPGLTDRFDGIALRVPTVTGSIADITFIAKQTVTIEMINQILSQAASDSRFQGLLAVTDEPIVSTDIIGRTEAAIVDLNLTRVVGGNLVKVLIWYDNELGYAETLIRHVLAAGRTN